MHNNSVNTKIIEDYRKENQLSVTKFCKLCQITPGTYKKIMSNESFNIKALFKIAKILGIHACQMFC